MRIDGDLDLYNSREFSQEVDNSISDWKVRVLADLSRLKFIDSSGFGALLSINRRLKAAGGGLLIYGLDDNIRILFKRIIAEKVLPVYDDEETALKNLR